MMKILWTLILTMVLCSCDKNELSALPNGTNQDGKLIQSYVVNDKWECIYRYNDDNTLQEIVFKNDGLIECTESFKYENGKIIESIKQHADGSNKVKKEFEYKDQLIVKKIEYINGELYETANYKYDKDNFLEEIITKISDNDYEFSRTTTIRKLDEGNKLRVESTNVAPHVISYDEKLAPQCIIPEYKPIFLIDNKGISGNILLTEIYVGDNISTVIEADIKFDNEGKKVLGSKVTYKEPNMVNVQEFKYNY